MHWAKDPIKRRLVNEKRKQTNLERHGNANGHDAEALKKIKQTSLKNWGVENPLQSQHVRMKGKRTIFERYGVENVSQSEEIKEKKKQTCLKHYGVGVPLKSKEIQEKVKYTCLRKYGVENPSQFKEIHRKILQSNIERHGIDNPAERRNKTFIRYSKKFLEKVKKFRQENDVCDSVVVAKFEMNDAACSRYLRSWGFQPGTITTPELQIIHLLENKFPGLMFEIHDRKTLIRRGRLPLEIDILIPSLNLGIEVNGSYWHQNDPENYKYNKYLLAKEKEVDLLHLYVESKFDDSTLMIIEKLIRQELE